MNASSTQKAYTSNHKRYFDSISNKKAIYTLGVGPAGCGKTYVACTAAIRMLTKKEVKKVVITRPAVCAGEEHGFLPGDINGKMQPYVRPIYDCILDNMAKSQLEKYIESDAIEISPFAYMRGRTFSNTIIIADECQNTTPLQMKMLLTRVGMNSSMIITGDPDQSDIAPGYANGLTDLLDRIDRHFETVDECVIDLIKFEMDDILRNNVMNKILDLYKL